MFDYFFWKGLDSGILSACFSFVCSVGTNALDTQFLGNFLWFVIHFHGIVYSSFRSV